VRLPDFFIVGHGKCGTTALHQMLRRHPQIHMPVKEPRYFAPDRRTRYWRPASSMRRHPTTLEGYLALFTGARPDQRIGEATPTYLRSTLAAENIAAVHLQAVRNYDETERDFRKAIALEDSRRAGRNIPRLSQFPQVLMYSELIRYVEQLRRYHAAFGAEQVLVLIYDDFRADNEGTVRQVLRFLDVDDTLPVPPVELDTLRTPRYVWLDQVMRVSAMVRRTTPGGKLAEGLTMVMPPPLHKSSTRAELARRIRYTDTPPPDQQLMLELRRRFKPEVQATSEYLGRDLVALWGYDSM
jgi:hypothetical protein